mgnify:CR=1 FL=1
MWHRLWVCPACEHDRLAMVDKDILELLRGRPSEDQQMAALKGFFPHPADEGPAPGKPSQACDQHGLPVGWLDDELLGGTLEARSIQSTLLLGWLPLPTPDQRVGQGSLGDSYLYRHRRAYTYSICAHLSPSATVFSGGGARSFRGSLLTASWEGLHRLCLGRGQLELWGSFQLSLPG